SGHGTARRLLAFGVVATGSYGIIAAGRGSFYPNDMATIAGASQARYHYVGSVPLTIIVCLVVTWFGNWRHVRRWYSQALLTGWTGLMLFCYVRFGAPINHYDDSREETRRAIAEIRAAVDAAPGRDVRIQNRWFRHIGILSDRRQF